MIMRKNYTKNCPKRKSIFSFMRGLPPYTKWIFMYLVMLSPIILTANMILSKNLGLLETLYCKGYFYFILAIPSLVIISTIFLVLLRSIFRLRDICHGMICGIHELAIPNTKNKKLYCFIFALFSALIVLIVRKMPHSLLNNGIYITHFIIIMVLMLTVCILHYISISANKKPYTAYDYVYFILFAVLILMFVVTVGITWTFFCSMQIYTMGPNGSIAEMLGNISYQPPQMFMASGNNEIPPLNLGNQSNVPHTSMGGRGPGNVPYSSMGGRNPGNVPYGPMDGRNPANIPTDAKGNSPRTIMLQGFRKWHTAEQHIAIARSRYNPNDLWWRLPIPQQSLLELSDSFEKNVWGINGWENYVTNTESPRYPPNPYIPILEQYLRDPNLDPRAPFEIHHKHSRDWGPIREWHFYPRGFDVPERLEPTNSGQLYDPIRDTHNATGNSGQRYDPIRDTYNATGGSRQ